jgi:hypothetical protein
VNLYLISTILAVCVSFLLLGLAHFCARRLWGELPQLICYVAGVGLILVVYGAWSAAMGELWAFLALAAIVAGAGGGTVLGWWADAVAERREHTTQALEALQKEVRVLEGRARDGAGPGC